MNLKIIACSINELDLLASIVRKTFIDAFASHNDPDDFANYVNTSLSDENLAKQLNNPDCEFFFVKMDDNIAGYFKINFGLAQTEMKDQDSVELERIYVCEEFQGMRIGAWMLEQVMAIGKQRNKLFLWLGVWEHNTSAIRFYKRYGFVKFGEHPYYVGKDKQMDWLMRLDLVNLNS